MVILMVTVAALLTNAGAGAPETGSGTSGALAGSGSPADGAPAALRAQVAGARLVDAPFVRIADVLLGGSFLADGTLMKPLLVSGAVPGTDRLAITIYTVRPGDTLTTIAARFGVSMMTIWWANDLRSKDLLHVGQQLRIPPVSGILYTVREGDTLASIARLTRADVQAIRDFNELTSDTLLIGQRLMIPDGLGPPIPTPAPTPRPTPAPIATPLPQPLTTFTGLASWMWASGTAARLPLGTLLRICGDGGCVERRVTSWGPADPDRIVDLSAVDFPVVCGRPLSTGLAYVRVDILPG